MHTPSVRRAIGQKESTPGKCTKSALVRQEFSWSLPLRDADPSRVTHNRYKRGRPLICMSLMCGFHLQMHSAVAPAAATLSAGLRGAAVWVERRHFAVSSLEQRRTRAPAELTRHHNVVRRCCNPMIFVPSWCSMPAKELEVGLLGEAQTGLCCHDASHHAGF